MKIEENKLIIDDPISEMEIDELLTSLKQEQISEVIVQNDDLHAGAIQALWCVKNKKSVTIESEFLKPFFEHVIQRQAS